MMLYDGQDLLSYENLVIKKTMPTWRCRLTNNTYWNVEDGNQPNWFHRKMQQLCFGFKWEKVNGELQDCQ